MPYPILSSPFSSEELFSRFAPFVRDFIYESGWEGMREVQRQAAGVLFSSEDNLLLCSATASGKTEAAFFPILTMLCERPPLTFGVLYIAPLKSLINDQYERMERLLRLSEVPLTHWHGDVASSHKQKALREPRGILQITPESLEGMLMNRQNDLPRLFGDLRFIVIDELHSVMNSDRGRQISCQMARLGRAIGYHPRRVALSATLGDREGAARFLGAGSGRDTAYTTCDEQSPAWRLGVAHFFIQNDHFDQTSQNPAVHGENAAAPATPSGDAGASGGAAPGASAPTGGASPLPVGGRIANDGVNREGESAGDAKIPLASSNGSAPQGSGPSRGEAVPSSETALASASPDGSDELPECPAGFAELRALQSAQRGGSGEAGRAAFDPGYEYLYESARGRSCLLFSNSREETEYVTATLRQIAEARGDDPGRFLIHHGNLSASLREETEAKLKRGESGERYVACATVTLELGIDIGILQRILHNGAPTSVCGFLQRLGRSGRRGQPPEMVMVLREEMPLPDAPLPKLIPWELLRAIAIVQLYAEEKFIEPPGSKPLPLSLLFQQTLSALRAAGELTPVALAGRVLALPPFAGVPRELYRDLLRFMLREDFLEATEEGGLIIGLSGERLTNSFRFYATFKDEDDFTVRAGSDEIGTVSSAPPVGDRFALAGRVWEVEEVSLSKKLIFVHGVKGKMEISWPGGYGEIHTRVLQRMRQVLAEDTVYPYLLPNAAARLAAARRVARATGVVERSLIHLGGYSYCLFPWLGTRSFRAMRRILQKYAPEFGISAIAYEGCYDITFKMEGADERTLPARLLARLREDGGENLDARTLLSPTECPASDKYDYLLPPSLLRESYAANRLNAREAVRRWEEIAREESAGSGQNRAG